MIITITILLPLKLFPMNFLGPPLCKHHCLSSQCKITEECFKQSCLYLSKDLLTPKVSILFLEFEWCEEFEYFSKLRRFFKTEKVFDVLKDNRTFGTKSYDDMTLLFCILPVYYLYYFKAYIIFLFTCLCGVL